MKKSGFIKLIVAAGALTMGFLYPLFTKGLLWELASEINGGAWLWVLIGLPWFVASGVMAALGLRETFSEKGTAFLMIPGWSLFGFAYIFLCLYGIVEDFWLGRIILEASGAEDLKALYVILLLAGLGLTAFSFISVFMGGSSSRTSTSWHLVDPVGSTTAHHHSSIPSNFCENCGSPIVEGNRFCGVCGTSVPGGTKVAGPAETYAPKEEEFTSAETYRSVGSYTTTERYEEPRTEEAPKSRLKSTFRK